METPPTSSAELTDPLSAGQPPEAPLHVSKGDMIRSNLGRSILQDFGYYRDILEEHVSQKG